MLRQYRVLLRLGIASATQYRLDFVVTAFGAVCYEAVSLAFVGVVVSAFGTIGGWTFTEIAFIYGIRTMGHALHSAVTGQLWATDHVIRDGEFDRYLLRPVDPLVQLLTRRFQVTAVGDIAFGVAVVIITALTAPIDWSPWKIGYLVAAVLGSAFAESAVMLGIAGLSFRLLSVNPLLSAADMMFVTFGPYPLSVLPRAVAWILTLVIPLAFTAYFPAAILLGRTDDLYVPIWLAVASPLVGLLLWLGSIRFFHHQIRHYASPGH